MKELKRRIAVIIVFSMMLLQVTPAFAGEGNIQASASADTGAASGADAKYASTADAEYASAADAESDLLLINDYETPLKSLFLSKSAAPQPEVWYDGSDWMHELNGDMRVKNLTLPETHDAGTYNIRFTRLDRLTDALTKAGEKVLQDTLGKALGGITAAFLKMACKGVLNSLVNSVAGAFQKKGGQCQDLNIEEQLENGVRALDLRFRYDDGKFYVYHGDKTEGMEGFFGTCECYDNDGKNSRLSLEMVFQKVDQFLEEHKDEAVFLKVQNEGGPYNTKVEEELKKLETKYGICSDYSRRDGKGTDFSGLGNMRLDEIRGNVYDITDAVKDITDGTWEATPETKKEKIRDAIENKALGLPGEIQCNVQAKIPFILDPNHECTVHFIPEYTTVLGVKILKNVRISFRDIFITPRQNAETINPFTDELLEKVTDERPDRIAENGLGLVSMDFISRERCWRIANVNSVNEDWGPVFLYGGGDDPDDPVDPDPEDIVADFSGLNTGKYEITEGDGQRYGGRGEICFKVSAEPENYIGTVIGEDPVPEEYAVMGEDGRLLLRQEFIGKLPEGTHHIGIMFLDGSAFGSFTVVKENRSDAEDSGSDAQDSGSYEKPYTGTVGNPVSDGKWEYDEAAGTWSYTAGRKFTDTWGYICNPYDENRPAWFYFDKNGGMLTGWHWIFWNGSCKCFYFNPKPDNRKGACQLGGVTDDGYTVDENGAWTVNGVVQER